MAQEQPAALQPAAAALVGPAPASSEVFFALNPGFPVGQVRALAYTRDGRRLCLAGYDKVVQVIPTGPDARPEVQTLRWEIDTERFGKIEALVREADSDVVAYGGTSFRGVLGDLIWQDAASGQTVAVEHYQDSGEPGAPPVGITLFDKLTDTNTHVAMAGHRQVIAALAASSDGDWIASADVAGTALVRSRRKHLYRALQTQDARPTAPRRPIAIAGNEWVAVPQYLPGPAGAVPAWRINVYSLREIAAGRPSPPQPLAGGAPSLLTALAGSPDGRWLVGGDSGNQGRQVYVWDLSQLGAPPLKLDLQGGYALSFAFHPARPVVAIGCQRGEAGELRLFDLTGRQWLRAPPVAGPVYACAFSPGAGQLAVAALGSNVVQVSDDPLAGLPLRPLPRARTPSDGRVQFQNGQYAIDYVQPAAGAGAAQWLQFTVESLAWNFIAPPPPRAPRALADWEVVPAPEVNRGEAQVRFRGRPAGVIHWDGPKQGRVTALSLLSIGGQPAVALGLESSHRILIYQLLAAGECPLVRVCWGHTGIVRSLYSSPDPAGRYLISRADDGTLRFWSLERSLDPDPLWRRWGARLTPVAGGLEIAALDDNGPLFNKGARTGDLLKEIQWRDAAPQRLQDPQAIAQRLAALPPQTVVSFSSQRGGQARPDFQVLEAWYPLLSFLAVDDQWIAWNSAGYYTCSAGGERLIGWQLNNALGMPPAFFTAEQFNKVFYRSDVVQKLLTTGHVTAALELASGQARTAVQALTEVLPPSVEVKLPDRQQTLVQDQPIRVRVEAKSRSSEPIEAIQALVDGTRYGPPRKPATTGPAAGVDLEIKLPPGEHKISGVAITQSAHSESAAVEALVQRDPNVRIDFRPKLFLLSVGISRHRDHQWDLEAPEKDARNVAAVMQAQFPNQDYAGIEARVLVNEQATRAAIGEALAAIVKEMRPNIDVGVVFFSCHGDVDGEFFLLPHDYDESNKPATAFFGKDLVQHFIDSQNQWMLILNTCHAGAIDDLLLKMRTLGTRLGRFESSVQLLAACSRKEIALQDHFAAAVVRGLQGGADLSEVKGLVETGELRLFVGSTVRSSTQNQQHPVESNTTSDRPFVLTKTPAAAP